MQDRHGVKRQHNLLVSPSPPQTHVQLVEVLLQDFRRLLYPYVCKLPLGESHRLELFGVVQALEYHRVAVGAGNPQIALFALKKLIQSPTCNNLAEQGKGTISVSSSHSTHHQNVAQRQHQQSI